MESSPQMIDEITRIDESLTLAINGLHTPATDMIWKVFSEVQIWFPLYALIAFILLRKFGWKRGAIFILSLVLGLVLCDQTANLFKYSVARLRPCYNWEMMTGGLQVLEGRGGYYGFFSAHAANVFSLASASVIAMRTDKSNSHHVYSSLIFIWAFCVAISRVFVGKHFLGDVLVGILVGLFIGIILGHTARRMTVTFSVS